MVKKYMKKAMGFTAAGIGLGVLGGMDKTGATGKISGAMPLMGSVVATGMTLDALDSLKSSAKLPKKKKR